MKAAAQTVLPNIHSLSDKERNAFMRDTFLRQSRFQREFSADAMEFDSTEFSHALRSEVIRLLEAKNVAVPEGKLEELHLHVPQEFKDYNFNDGVNKLSNLLYDTDAAFTAQYHRFVKACVGKYFAYPFYFQATPTIRVHCPDGKNSNHYPRYHTDIGYGHPPEEINIWLPLTAPRAPQYHGFRRMDVASSCKVLDTFGFDFTPFIDRAINDKPFNATLDPVSPEVTTELDKFLAFDSRAIHTTEPLKTHTRVSLDIRIMPVEDFCALPVEYQGTQRRKMRYIPGEGYHRLSSQDL